MTFIEFIKQDRYCRNSAPHGPGCDECPCNGLKGNCADELRNIAGRFIEDSTDELRQRLEDFGISKWNQIDLFLGYLTFAK